MMNDIIRNIDALHTTELGVARIKRNLVIDVEDVVDYLKNKILNKDTVFYKQGKNWYCLIDSILITINSFNYCIITAHLK